MKTSEKMPLRRAIRPRSPKAINGPALQTMRITGPGARTRLPTLGQGERLTRSAAGQRIFDWLQALDAPLNLLADSDYDTVLLAELLQQCGLAHASFRIQQLVFTGKPQTLEFEAAKQRYLASHGLAPHHALSDAAALRAAWQQTMTIV